VRWFALAFWLLLLGGWWLYARQNDLTPAETVRALSGLLIGRFGPLIYILLYALRPVIFFPATLITVLGGFLFGPLGILWTVIGANSSALVAWAIGRFFGGELIGGGEGAGIIGRYADRMRANSFETVLLMRLLFLPYDLVNYASGFLRIRWQPFLLATAIGSIPGTISFVLFGTAFGTLDDLLTGQPRLNPATLILSVLLILASIALSRYLKGRETGDRDRV
jgi:uncharacterized membrane protein YdjX (TVP38/TMEM64 family)